MRLIEDRDPFVGEPTGLIYLRFTEAERRVLRRASTIAEEARDLLRTRYDDIEAEALPIDLELAAVEHGCADLLELEGRSIV